MPKHSVQTRDPEWFQKGLDGIMARYVEARLGEHLDSSHPLWSHAKRLQSNLEGSEVVKERANLKVRWSFGQGAWARIPWLALLDQRIARATSDGIYVIYLFREDMSGVYATLNQGITKEKERLGGRAGQIAIRERAAELRSFAGALKHAGFELSHGIDLRSQSTLAQDYPHGTVAHRFYEAGNLPKTHGLLEDLRLLLEAYDAIVRGRPAGRG